MTRHAQRTPWVLLLALLAAAAGAHAEPAQDLGRGEAILAALTPQLLDRLLEKRVIILEELSQDELYGGTVHAFVIFERSRNETLRMLIQGPRQREYRPELRKAEVVEQHDGGAVVDYEMRMMLMRFQYRMRYGWDFEQGRVWWALDPDHHNDFSRIEGIWELFALAPRESLARFSTRIEVGPAVPAFLQDLATRKALPEAMENTRRWIDSGGRYRP